MIISFCGSKSLSVGRCDQNLDQGAKFCSIFKVLEMRRKWYHCIRLIFLIPAVYLLSQTESIWRSYRDLFAKANRQKFDADCTCPYSPYSGDVASSYGPYDDRTVLTWRLMISGSWTNLVATHGISLANGRVPRGPINGCHVAPVYWLLIDSLVY
jgi:hypothetical protein